MYRALSILHLSRASTEDMWPDDNQEEDEPDWVTSEREEFPNTRDKNNDGKMDREELADWIIPDDYDHSDAEAKHLIFEADVPDSQGHKVRYHI